MQLCSLKPKQLGGELCSETAKSTRPVRTQKQNDQFSPGPPPRAPHCRSSRQASFLSDPHCPCLLIVSHLPSCKCASVAFWLGLPCGQPKCGSLSRKPLQCNSECRWLDVSTGGIWDAAATQNPHMKTQRTPRRHRSPTEFPPQFSENPPGQVTTESPTPILREPPPGEVTILALTSQNHRP